MSQIKDEAEAESVIVDSTLTVECLYNQNICAIPEKSVRLQKFSGAYWTLSSALSASQTPRFSLHGEIYYAMAFRFQIVNFPEELQKDCFTEFSVSLPDVVEPKIYQKSPFQSSFCGGPFDVSNTMTSFTANLTITKKNSADSLRKSLLSSISGLFEDETLSDFTFIVKGKPFKVHKSILGASSVVMKRMFTAEYREKETSECEIVDIEPQIFEALIRFMYCCEVPKNLNVIAYELYEAGHYYEIETLKKICLDEILSKLWTGNAIKAYALAFKYDLDTLSADSWMIIKRYILKDCPENVKPMPPDEIEKILEIRKKKDDEVQSVFNKYTETTSTLRKKIRAKTRRNFR